MIEAEVEVGVVQGQPYCYFDLDGVAARWQNAMHLGMSWETCWVSKHWKLFVGQSSLLPPILDNHRCYDLVAKREICQLNK